MTRSVFHIVARLLVVGLFALALPAALRADSAGVQFSATNNPSGIWSYGYTTLLGGSFSRYNSRTSICSCIAPILRGAEVEQPGGKP